MEKYLTHDELIELIFQEYEKSDKKKYTSLFLSSLSTNQLSYRSGLPVFAKMQSFPRHTFSVRNNPSITCSHFNKMSEQDRWLYFGKPCQYCSEFIFEEMDTELIERCFSYEGGLIIHGLLDYYYYLSQTNKLDFVEPTESDFRIFSEILTLLLNAGEKDTVKKTVQAEMRKIK